jgi:hypothetical protein
MARSHRSQSVGHRPAVGYEPDLSAAIHQAFSRFFAEDGKGGKGPVIG